MYPTRSLKVPKYNWTVEAYSPTVGEVDALQNAYKSGDWTKVKQIWSTLIVKWDCTNRQGQPLPVSSEGIDQLPMDALKTLTTALYTFEGEPKNA